MQAKAKIVAEVGCNHQGSFEKAKELIIEAAYAGADVVKFQKRCNLDLLTPEEYNRPHPVPANSFGPTYGRHREALEFSIDKHFMLMKFCEQHGVEYSTSVWDQRSAYEVAQIKPKHIKIPSACNLVSGIYDELRGWAGTLHVSLGMSTEEEKMDIEELVMSNWEVWSPVLYCCTSGYPVQPIDCYLGDIEELIGSAVGVGYSGHHLGTNIDVAAYAMGAEWIERHFTFDKAAKGTDHAASLDFAELVELRQRLDEVQLATGCKKTMPDVELEQRSKLKRGLR